MIYPGYQLNPGDMFQVDPERVLFATGAPKDRRERRAGRKARAKTSDKTPEDDAEPEKPKEPPVSTPTRPEEPARDPKDVLKDLLEQAKTLLSVPSEYLSAKKKQDLRAFQRTVKRTLSRPNALTTSSLDQQLDEITARISATSSKSPPPESPAAPEVPSLSTPALRAEAATLSPGQMKTLRSALQEARENPVDHSKPYATPWRPRDWMSAFAFVPRYLEVHQKICSAVYLRHPVARPGLAEVPSPYPLDLNSLAHNWYLRRR